MEDAKEYLEDYISKTMKTNLTVAIKTILDENEELKEEIEMLRYENYQRAEDEFEKITADADYEFDKYMNEQLECE